MESFLEEVVGLSVDLDCLHREREYLLKLAKKQQDTGRLIRAQPESHNSSEVGRAKHMNRIFGRSVSERLEQVNKDIRLGSEKKRAAINHARMHYPDYLHLINFFVA